MGDTVGGLTGEAELDTILDSPVEESMDPVDFDQDQSVNIEVTGDNSRCGGPTTLHQDGNGDVILPEPLQREFEQFQLQCDEQYLFSRYAELERTWLYFLVQLMATLHSIAVVFVSLAYILGAGINVGLWTVVNTVVSGLLFLGWTGFQIHYIFRYKYASFRHNLEINSSYLFHSLIYFMVGWLFVSWMIKYNKVCCAKIDSDPSGLVDLESFQLEMHFLLALLMHTSLIYMGARALYSHLHPEKLSSTTPMAMDTFYSGPNTLNYSNYEKDSNSLARHHIEFPHLTSRAGHSYQDGGGPIAY